MLSPDRAPDKRAILIVDDHPLMRRGLKAMIADEPDLFVSGEASDSHGALAAIARRAPDLAIVDLALEGGADGLDLVRALKIRYPAIPAF